MGCAGSGLAPHDLTEAFVRPMPSRWATVQSALWDFPAQTVLVDPLFLAGIPLLLTRSGNTPRVFVLGFLPLTLEPLAPPGPFGWLREPVTRFAMHRALAPVQHLAERLTSELTGQALPSWFTQWVGLSDGILQMTCPGFEYPRRHPTPPIHFVGPPASSTSQEYPLPLWWRDLDTDRPIVHLTQGTVANSDLTAVVEPTLAALAERDCLVVVSTGGAPPPQRLPANARMAPFLPYDELPPRCAVMVTNGGYGGVNLALRHGVPLVVVGATEDKRPIAERVTWSRTGVGIPRTSARPNRIARAVDQVLADSAYRENAERLSRQMTALPGVREVLSAR